MTASDAGPAETQAKVLAALSNAASLTSIGDVLQVMEALEAVLPDGDGVKWFNLLYLYVTKAVHAAPPTGGWHDQQWLTQLDIHFAHLFFDALANSYTAPQSVPRAWDALFQARYDTNIHRIQFALAGMNAHINHDLPLAVVQTCESVNSAPARGTPQYADFEAVNGLINTVEPQTIQFLFPEIDTLVAQDLNVVGQIVDNWSIQIARDTAWNNAEVLWHVRDYPLISDSLQTSWDRITGFAGRGLLLSVPVPGGSMAGDGQASPDQ